MPSILLCEALSALRPEIKFSLTQTTLSFHSLKYVPWVAMQSSPGEKKIEKGMRLKALTFDVINFFNLVPSVFNAFFSLMHRCNNAYR